MCVENTMVNLLDLVFDIKNKISNQEYIEIMQSLKTLHTEINNKSDHNDIDIEIDHNIDDSNCYYNGNVMSDSDSDDDCYKI